MSEQPHNVIVAVGASHWVLPNECVPVVADFFYALRRQGTPVVRDYDDGGWRESDESDWQPPMDIGFSNTTVLPPKAEEKEATDES